jgi:hypothetical protein
MHTCKLERRKRSCQYQDAGLDQLLMEFQKLVLVVLQNLKVAFQWAFLNTLRPRGSLFCLKPAALLCIKTRSAIASEYFPLQSLQQVEASISASRSFNRKLRRSRLELTEINLRFKLIIMRRVPHCMPRRRVARARDSCRPAHEFFHQPLHNSHQIGMASCISCHY